jgi:hypothetical protein
MYCKCKPNTIVPPARVGVDCSTTKKVSYIPIIANKQVLEVQVVSQELSAAVHKAWRRK